MNRRTLIQFLFLVLALFPIRILSKTLQIKELSFLTINSAITPATFDYLSSQMKRLPTESLIVIKMNTPGGLVSTTKDIIGLIGKSPQPVVVWVTPEAASAASAGSIIASAAHFIFMSPGTTMGAATPVGLGEDLKESDGKRKALNDLTSLVRSLSTERGRPSAPFEEMITKASSFTATEARDLNIASVVTDETQIKTILEGKSLKLLGKEVTLQFANNPISKTYEQTPGQKLLEVLANPTTAYFIFLIAVALIYFEFQAPGGYVSGSIGVSLLVIAGIAFQVLPLDWGAFCLILIGIFLLIVELYVTSYGLLFLSGLAFFVMGSLFLFQDQSGFISVRYSMIFSGLAGVLLSVGGLTWYLIREQKRQPPTGNFFLPENTVGTVMTKNEKFYQVKVRGEIWNAVSEDSLSPNDQIVVTKVDSNTLQIEVKKKSLT